MLIPTFSKIDTLLAVDRVMIEICILGSRLKMGHGNIYQQWNVPDVIGT